MERPYYFAKLGIVAVAMALAYSGSHVRTPHPAQHIGAHSGYSAAAELQTAAWRATTRAGRLIACLASTHFAKT